MTTHDPAPLTPSECRVLSLAAEGLANDQIGRRLYLSTSTVKNNLHIIYEKLDVQGHATHHPRCAACLWWRKRH